LRTFRHVAAGGHGGPSPQETGCDIGADAAAICRQALGERVRGSAKGSSVRRSVPLSGSQIGVVELGFVNDQERRFFSQLPLVDGTVLDVGANLGIVSVILARRFADRVIYAFEPNPTTYAALQDNLALNPLRQRASACSGNCGS
jgi:hypothetical protein